MLFLFHSVTGAEIEGPTIVYPYARFHPEAETLDTLRVNHGLFHDMARWIAAQGGAATLELVVTVPENEESILIDVPDDLALHFKLRWCGSP